MSDTALTHSQSQDTGAVEPIASVGDFLALLKPRVMSLVVFTALVGLVAAPGSLHPIVAFAAILCIAVGAGASGALNMWYDSDIDAVMSRTRSRPIPAGRVSREEAFTFGATLALFSVVMMGVLVNWVASALLAFTIFFYAVVYTMWLKRWTAQNIVIGGAAGALPPVIGWASVTGGVSLEPLILFAIIFLWTPPHFWALALVKADDYKRAGIPMMPSVAGEKSTRDQILYYAIALAATAMLPVVLGYAGYLYASVTSVLSFGFIALAGQLSRLPAKDKGIHPQAMRLFAFSILYLFAVFAMVLVEKLTGFTPVWSL